MLTLHTLVLFAILPVSLLAVVSIDLVSHEVESEGNHLMFGRMDSTAQSELAKAEVRLIRHELKGQIASHREAKQSI